MKHFTRFRRALGAGIASLAAVAGPTLPAQAAVHHHSLTRIGVSLNGRTVSTPYSFADHGTAFVPVWYLMRALDSLHVSSSWNGREWRMVLPSDMKPELRNASPGTGSVAIFVNGKLVKRVSGITDYDPASGHSTMYLPIWYVMNVLHQCGVHSTWDGKRWAMTVQTPSPAQSPPPAPVDSNPQAATQPGAVAKAKLVADLITAFAIPVDQPPAVSPYDDLAATDPFWPAVAAADSRHLLAAFSATHYGAGDVVTLQDAEQFCWNALGIGPAQYQPGQTVAAWAQFTGLDAGVAKTAYLTVDEEQQLLANIAYLQAGWAPEAGGLRVVYTPADEYRETFASAVAPDGTRYFPTIDAVQQAIRNTYQFFDGITFTGDGNQVTVSVPLPADGTWFPYATAAAGPVSYSLDGGRTWTDADSFDASELTDRPAEVLLRAPAANGIEISFNRMLPQARGSVVLGAVDIWYDTSPHVQRIALH